MQIIIMAVTAGGSIVLTVVFLLIFLFTGAEYAQILYITFLTIAYHFLMRLAVGEAVTLIYRNKEFKYDAPWYQPRKFEKKLYRFLKVKKWKGKMLTAKPEQFDVRNRTLEELMHYMTQAEVVHEIIMVLSFLPLLLIIPYGEAAVFIITSVVACLADLVFVIMQRYNRPRVVAIKKKMDGRKYFGGKNE